MQDTIRIAGKCLRLDVADKAFAVYRDDRPILRGRFDAQSDLPRITAETNGWRIEHGGGDTQDAFELSSAGHWFGGQELLNQLWPMERVMLHAAPFITSDNEREGLSGVQAPVWVASSGAAILADHGQELHVSLNRPRAEPSAASGSVQLPFNRRPPPDDGTGDGLLRLGGWGLTYRLLVSENSLQAWRSCLARFGHPNSIPPEEIWRSPIWTTWARYKTDIYRERVLGLADQIIAHGYPHGVMEIDDRWQVHYGDFAFDPVRFPDARAMVDELHARGFAVTCWVMPFIQPDADNYPFARDRGYLLRQSDGSPRHVKWWQGSGFLLDATNPEALAWFGRNLRLLQKETGIDGFKFDAGEAIYAGGLNEYTRRYVDFAAALFPLSEVRCGWGNQRASILFRQWDKSSRWGLDNGLRSVITGALSMGLAGYPFVLPDMVGGNAWMGEDPGPELMVRWTQASALFPAIQLSLAPWQYGQDCDRLCRAALGLREDYIDSIAGAMRMAAESGEPVIRPVWWLAPDDERALLCDDEFLVGKDLLVAPVMTPGETERSVYLPPGSWRESGSSATVEGPVNICAVPAPLDKLLTYVRDM